MTTYNECLCSLGKFVDKEQGNNCLNIQIYGYDCFGRGPNNTKSPSGSINKYKLANTKFGPCKCDKMYGWLYLTDRCNCGVVAVINDRFYDSLGDAIIVDLNTVNQRVNTWNRISKNPEYGTLIKNRIINVILCYLRIPNMEIELVFKILGYLRPIELFSYSELSPFWNYSNNLYEYMYIYNLTPEIPQVTYIRELLK
jgi:hypothetical protein